MKYFLSQSFGKDSMAQAIIAAEMGEPVDGAIYCEVMFDKEISAEIPEHRDFIYNTAIPRLEREYGMKTTILRAEKTMIDNFFRVLTKGKNKGKLYGFPIPGMCKINSDCKMKVINTWKKAQTEPITMYVGIAADERKRLNRLRPGNVSLLEKYGVTEKMAIDICKSHGLLSPIYSFTSRNGCFFCPNAKKQELLHLYNNHRDIWDMLLTMQSCKNLAYPYWKHGKTLYDIQRELEE